MNFCEISKKYFDQWVLMGVALWPYHKKSEIEKEFSELFQSNKHTTFLCVDEHDKAIGFINLSLRYEHVQGATKSPVAYVEGIYVNPDFRKKGVAKDLVEQAEIWAKKKGCNELASDTELHNTISQKFHKNLGFKTAETIIHFIKVI
jgi:aminoglycoside 6'-N-acetyltransferase I